jgi:serine protease inhibitor
MKIKHALKQMTALLVAAAIPGTALASTAKDAKNSIALVVKGNNAFAIDLYQRERGEAGNLFFSPYSISTALAMTWAGARGQTEQEMARVLHFTLPQEDVHRAFGELTERCDEIQKRNQISLNVANSLWCQRDYHFTEAFLKVNRTHYRAEARLVDFVGNTEAARQEINAWVAKETRDKIQDLLQPPVPSHLTTLVLCNAIYFKGKWATPFDPKATAPAPFVISAGRSVQVPTMSQKLNLRSRDAGDFKLFALPYTGGDLSLVILLPKAVDGLTALEQQLSADRLQKWLAGLDAAPESKAVVYLPRFKLNCRLELAKELAAMGMPSAFVLHSADFSGMTGTRGLNISDVVHQAFVEVSEEGTEAAVATAVVMDRAEEDPVQVFQVDHPFMFLIRENQTGNILFLGRTVDPSR